MIWKKHNNENNHNQQKNLIRENILLHVNNQHND
jgi:hypothetical protein